MKTWLIEKPKVLPASKNCLGVLLIASEKLEAIGKKTIKTPIIILLLIP